MGSQEGMDLKKRAHINFFETACTGSHMSVGMWRDPKDNSREKDRLEYYIWLAKVAERGKVTSIFFADTYTAHDTYQSSPGATYRGGSQVAQLDPTIVVSAMAAVTKSVSFGITGSTSYLKPFLLARTWSTLDHFTNGRIGWNVVTSYSDSSAQAMGMDSIMPREERYAAAHEYMDLAWYTMWESSWEDGAQIWDDKKGAYDSDKIHKINWDGKYHKMYAIHQAHPSPQRTPVIFQAGASTSGVAFAGKHAECIYCGSMFTNHTKKYVDQVRAAAVKNGRDPKSIKFFAGISPIVASTMEEAQAIYDKCLSMADPHAGLAKFSGYTGVDMSKYPFDEPFVFTDKGADNVIRGTIDNFQASAAHDGQPWTPRRLGMQMSFGGLYPKPVGTPEMVADVFERWIDEADIDGFNLAYVTNPMSYEAVVDLLLPELRRRGRIWDDYAVPGGTFRENLYREPGQTGLRPDHPGYQFKYDVKAKKEEKEAQSVETKNGEIKAEVTAVAAEA